MPEPESGGMTQEYSPGDVVYMLGAGEAKVLEDRGKLLLVRWKDTGHETVVFSDQVSKSGGRK